MPRYILHMAFKLHIIDPSPSRRASIARSVYRAGWHAEIYANEEEFIRCSPRSGIVLRYDTIFHDKDFNFSHDNHFVRSYNLPVILYRENVSLHRVVLSVKLGAFHYFLWPDSEDKFNTILDYIKTYYPKYIKDRGRYNGASILMEKLTKRERDVLKRLAQGMSNKQIASDIGISPRTVEIHRGNMMKKIKASSLAEALKIAYVAKLD